MAAAGLAVALSVPAQAAVIISPTPTLTGGTLVGFDGFPSGTIITTQYPGVTFGQVDGGTPMIDNPPYLFGYHSGLQSGTGVLTGSTNGGAPFPTVAGLTATFGTLQSDVQVFFSDTAPLGNYPITVFDSSNTPIESVTLLDVGGADIEDYVTFQEGSDIISSIQIGPSTAFGDSFAIDDLSFNLEGVPEPASLALLSFGLVSLGLMRRKRG
jgi:hypothetical protein